jgi:transcription-repair coupling factor (superfamily II helicase)
LGADSRLPCAILISGEYVESITERLSLYTRLDNCESENELQEFERELTDRFGAPPSQVIDLLDTVRCRKLAVDLGFEKMMLKDEVLKCYFINRPDSPYFESRIFHNILQYLQTGTNKARLRQVGKMFMLVVEPIKNMKDMLQFLSRMHVQVKQSEKGEFAIGNRQ